MLNIFNIFIFILEQYGYKYTLHEIMTSLECGSEKSQFSVGFINNLCNYAFNSILYFTIIGLEINY